MQYLMSSQRRKLKMSAFTESFRFGIRNIRKRPYRSFCLMLAAVIGSYALFVGLALKASLNNGIGRMQERMGADLMIVPESSEIEARNILLTGEPEFFYMDVAVATAAAEIEGVECATSQFYFTSLSSDCCSTRVQLIAFDPDTDFVINPWIDERVTSDVSNGSVIIGSEVTPLANGKVKFYGNEYSVAGKLGETATGLDHSVFMSRDTMHGILNDAKDKGYQFLNPEDDGAWVSTVLLRVSDDADITAVEKEIYNRAGGIKFIETDKLISDVAVKLGSVENIINVTLTVLLVFSFLTMILFFSVIFHERKKEFAVLRILGTSSRRICFFSLTEGITIGAAGGIIGLVLGILTVFPFNHYIENSLDVPYLMPSVAAVILYGMIGVLVTTLFGSLSSFLSTLSLAHAETYYTMRTGE